MPSPKRFKELTEVTLPRLAREGNWPLRLDHCFKRVCLDNACGGVWYDFIDKPAEKNMTESQLARATAVAESIARDGEPLLRCLNRNSLRWRSARQKAPD